VLEGRSVVESAHPNFAYITRKEQQRKIKRRQDCVTRHQVRRGHATLNKRSTACSILSSVTRRAFTTCSLVKSGIISIIWSILACETPMFDDELGPLKAGPGPVGIGRIGAGAGTA
jgi:hypothetical protein